MAERPTWWLVMTSPSGETKLADPPAPKRTEDFCKCSSHFASGAKPWRVSRSLAGGALNSHMPSSARPGLDRATAIAAARKVVRMAQFSCVEAGDDYARCGRKWLSQVGSGQPGRISQGIGFLLLIRGKAGILQRMFPPPSSLPGAAMLPFCNASSTGVPHDQG